MRKRLPATPLFQSSGVPTKALQSLLKECEIHDTDPKIIRDVTQRAWRKHGLQSAQIAEEDAHLRDRVLPYFRELGLVGVPEVPRDLYAWCVILGATYVAMHKRIAAAYNAHNSGAVWENTAYLTSQRPLFPDKEGPDVLRKPVDGGLPFRGGWERMVSERYPTNEATLTVYVWHQLHPRPWGIETERLVVAENKPDGKPAGTIETFQSFAEQQNPGGDALLIVSSQPHMLRQCVEASKVLGDRFERYVVTGYDMPGDVNVTKMLDELAKLIFDIVGLD